MKQAKVSVIVPLYNKAPYLKRCIDSILTQTFEDFELIIVDDGSTDDSVSIAKDITDPRLSIIQQANRGPGAARNRGVSTCTGSLCAFLDADDEWLPHYLQESLEALSLNPSVAAVASGYLEYPLGRSTEPMWRKRGISDGVVTLSAQHSATLLTTLLAYMSCWSTVARKSAIEKWGGFYEQDRCLYAEDSFLWIKMLLNEQVLFRTKPGAKFHREASDLSNILTKRRPIEPFLQYPCLIRDSCPEHLRDILEEFFAIRAFKTSCVLTYWGEWEMGRSLFFSFAKPQYWKLPFFAPALLLTNPLGAGMTKAFRWGVRYRVDSRSYHF